MVSCPFWSAVVAGSNVDLDVARSYAAGKIEQEARETQRRDRASIAPIDVADGEGSGGQRCRVDERRAGLLHPVATVRRNLEVDGAGPGSSEVVHDDLQGQSIELCEPVIQV